jgi:hypothetical protein
MSDEYPTSLRPASFMTEPQERALWALFKAPSPQDGLPVDIRTGTALVRRGWAEPGSHYPLFRITDAGRHALSAVKMPASRWQVRSYAYK